MSKDPLITIITPVLNVVKSGRTRFLRQCIESVHNQTYPNIEHIVKDGQSNDGTLELLKEYSDKGWIKVYSEKDSNAHEALNQAINKAKGEYFGIICSDDYYKDNDIIEYIVKNFINKENTEYIYGNEEQISFKNEKLIRTWYGNKDYNNFWKATTFNTCTMLISKKIFDEVGGFDTNYPYAADLKLHMQFRLNNYNGRYCGRTVDVVRLGKGISSDPDRMFFSRKDVAEICCWLWKQFEPEMTPAKAEYMLAHDNYSEIFLRKLRHFVIDKKLKNFDYISFSSYIDNLINNSNKSLHSYTDEDKQCIHSCIEISFYPFKNFPFIKILTNNSIKKIYILGIPFIKFKAN